MYCAEAKACSAALEKWAADEIALLGLARPDRHVGGAHADIDLFVIEDQLNADFRIEFAEFLQTRRQPKGSESDRRRHPQFTRGLRRRIGKQRFRRLQLCEDVRDGAVQKFALLGQNEAARVTVKEGHFEIGFERRNLAAHRRLAHVQLVAGMRKTAGLRGGVKNAKFVPVHFSALSVLEGHAQITRGRSGAEV